MGPLRVNARLFEKENKMRQNIIRKTEDELIHDKTFILWCLFPTQGLNEFYQDYLKLYPEDEAMLLSARNKVRKLRLSTRGTTMTSIEHDVLKNRIQQEIAKRQKRQLFLRVSYLAAACILLLFLVNLFQQTGFSENEMDTMPLTAESMQLDQQQTEVELQLPNEQTMQVPNNTEIRVDAKGKIQIENKAIHSIAQATSSVAVPQENILRVPRGRRSFLILPDSTKVWVNAGTILRFPQQFQADNRTIYVNGEIYLEVKKDATRPFYVKTSQMDIRVLGTSFCVTAYQEEEAQSVVLKEGLVAVNDRNGTEQKITPDEMLVLSQEKMTVQHVDPYNYISWIDGILQFKERDLGEILDQLSRYYRITFNCPEELESFKCSGKLVLFDDIHQVLNTLQTSLPISCQEKDDIIDIYPVK